MSNVAAIHEIAPLKQAIQEIRKHFTAATVAEAKMVSHRLDAGKKLNELRKRIEAGEAGPEWIGRWWDWYAVQFDDSRSRKDAEKVMRMAAAENPEAAAEEEREAARERMRRARAGDGANVRSNAPADVSGESDDAEASAEARKAEYDGEPTKEAPRVEVAKFVRTWVQASPEVKRQFVKERWDEIAAIRRQLDANGKAEVDRWIEGDRL